MKRSFQPILLLITDSYNQRNWVHTCLEAEHNILDAKTEKEAIDYAITNKLDFIIIDAHLFEEKKLFSFCHTLRQKIGPTLIPILLITGRLSQSFREKALHAGVTDFLSDQMDITELETRMAIARKSLVTENKIGVLTKTLQLTKLPQSSDLFKNKFLLNEKAIKEITQARQENAPLSVLLIKIDHFSALQEKYGPITNDEILIAVSHQLYKELKQKDILIPSNEGNFIIILPQYDEAKAHALADHIRKNMATQQITTSKGSLSLTLSIALTSYAQKGTSQEQFERMISVTNSALKKIRAEGNQVITVKKGESQ